MHILVKRIDTYKSTKHKGKFISEFIIYVMIDEVPIEAYTELSTQAVVDRIEELKKNKGIETAYFEIH